MLGGYLENGCIVKRKEFSMFNTKNSTQLPGSNCISENTFTQTQKMHINEIRNLHEVSEEELESVSGGGTGSVLFGSAIVTIAATPWVIAATVKSMESRSKK
jgi:hypothetical protein